MTGAIRDDHTVARDLATEAGEALLKLRANKGFDDPKALRDEGDASSHELLTASLSRLRPSDAILSEEGKDDPVRLRASRTWIIDPLDGTREFAEAGRNDWAVHVALWQQDDSRGDGNLVAGAVGLPAQRRTLSTLEPPKPRPFGGGRIRIAVSRTRPPGFVKDLAYLVGADLVPIGSAGAKIAAVLTGDVDAYVHAGGQYEWDSAAPVAVARAAGAHASRIDGSSLLYNQEHPSLPDILVCLPELAAKLLDGIRDVYPER